MTTHKATVVAPGGVAECDGCRTLTTALTSEAQALQKARRELEEARNLIQAMRKDEA